MPNLSGIYPPIVTPFDGNERVAYNKLESNLGKWLADPLDGVIMPGSNSESVFLTREERIQIWQVCIDCMRGSGKRLIAGTGVESTAETIALTQKAGEMGAEAALIIPPSFYKPSLTPEALIAHYQAVAEASPIPLLVYNVPAFTGIDFAASTLLKMAEHPRIIGFKDSSANVLKAASVLAVRPDLQVFAGTGSALLPFLALGGSGGIMALANFAAAPLRKVWNAFFSGQLEVARRVQLSLAEINNAVTSRFGVSGLKYAMDRWGYFGGPTRRPLLPLEPGPRAEIDALLAQLKQQY